MKFVHFGELKIGDTFTYVIIPDFGEERFIKTDKNHATKNHNFMGKEFSYRFNSNDLVGVNNETE